MTTEKQVNRKIERLANALEGMILSHPPKHHGKCPVCEHYGNDCLAHVAEEALRDTKKKGAKRP